MLSKKEQILGSREAKKSMITSAESHLVGGGVEG